jgi:MFS transporter, ACS family, tartrate transporter
MGVHSRGGAGRDPPFSVATYLRDRPTQVSWLTPVEQKWLTANLAQERREVEAVRTYTLFQALTNIRVLALAVIYFGVVTASVGLVIFVPQIIKQLANAARLCPIVRGNNLLR